MKKPTRFMLVPPSVSSNASDILLLIPSSKTELSVDDRDHKPTTARSTTASAATARAELLHHRADRRESRLREGVNLNDARKRD
jgi:hypothetical protein